VEHESNLVYQETALHLYIAIGILPATAYFQYFLKLAKFNIFGTFFLLLLILHLRMRHVLVNSVFGGTDSPSPMVTSPINCARGSDTAPPYSNHAFSDACRFLKISSISNENTCDTVFRRVGTSVQKFGPLNYFFKRVSYHFKA